MKRILPKTMSALALAMVSAPGAWAQTAPPKLGDAANAELDSIQSGLDKYENMARRSMLGGGSKPVSFSGEADAKLIGSTYEDYPGWMQADATQFKNSAVALRIGMVASPSRNMRLWSKLGLNSAMLGYMAPSNQIGDGKGGSTKIPYNQYRSSGTGEAGFKVGSLVYEDMAAGLVTKVGPTTWSAKLGGVLWNELSPLTVWKMQPRIFAWDYLPFELEQSTAQFYDYGTVKGEKSGRAAWNKKPFQGIQLESVDLPFGLYFNGFFGMYEGYNKNLPWLIPQDKNTELQYSEITYRSYSTKGVGIGDEYRTSSFLRLAKTDLPNGLAAGVNWFGYNVDKDYPLQWRWQTATDQPQSWITKNVDGHDVLANNFYVEPKVGSIDLRRSVPGGLSFHVDVAMSKSDTTFYAIDTALAQKNNVSYEYRSDMQAKAATVGAYQEIAQTSSGWVPGVYTSIAYPLLVADKQFDAELRTVYFPKKFQSVGSVVNPMDAIIPFEANMTGAGKFAGADNGTAYVSNLAGTNLIVKVPVSRGHAKISWGLHSQLETGNDIVYFPWRQNGEAYNASLASDFTQYDQGLLDDYLRSSGGTKAARQAKRFGDEYYLGKGNYYAPTLGAAGGARGAFLATYEGFGAYKIGTKDTNDAGMKQILDNLTNGTIPQSKKSTQNFSFDGSWELSRLWEGKRSVFLGTYVAFNSITKNSNMGIPAFSADDDNVLLAGKNIRFEPVVQLTPKFYLVGLIGNETWKSAYGVAAIDTATGLPITEDLITTDRENVAKSMVNAPIDYNDWIFGLGFDWDVAARVGLHVRCQKFTHKDKGISKEAPLAAGINDYDAWLTSAEVKMWF